jgi:NAD(P)-dependent dehydrogenase (short-subunit alcohol dehydrogenase family)
MFMQKIDELFDLTGKTAVVTGASYGLGVTFSQALAQQGVNLVLAARSAEKLNEVAASLTERGHAVLVAPCDVGDAKQVASMMERAVKRFGRVDVLVNNAGVVAEAGMLPERVPDTAFEQTVRVNLLGTWYCCREAGRFMLGDGKGGSIINIASVAGLSGIGNFPSSYQATKAAVINLTRNLAASWADRGVRVNALAPGWFPSEMTARAFSIPPFLEWAKKMAPMGRIGRPDELVGPLLFLASEASSFVTGQVLAVDGGVSAAYSSRCPDEAFEILAAAGLGELATPIRPAAASAR